MLCFLVHPGHPPSEVADATYFWTILKLYGMSVLFTGLSHCKVKILTWSFLVAPWVKDLVLSLLWLWLLLWLGLDCWPGNFYKPWAQPKNKEQYFNLKKDLEMVVFTKTKALRIEELYTIQF